MSVIFKTLKKLKSRQAPDKKRGLKGKKIYFFRKKLLSPFLILIFVFSVFIIGFGALYGVDNITDYIKSKRRVQATVAKNTRVHNQKNKTSNASNIEAHKSSEIKPKEPEQTPVQPKAGPIPPPPDSIVYEKSKPGRLYPRAVHTEKPLKETQTGAPDIVRYIPSKQSETQNIKSKYIQQPDEKSPALPDEKKTSITPPALPNKIAGNRTTTSKAAFLPKTDEKSGIASAAPPAPSAESTNNKQNYFPGTNRQANTRKAVQSHIIVPEVEFLSEKRKTSGFSPAANQHGSDTVEKPAFIPVDKQTDQYRTASVRQNNNKEKIYLADMEKCSKISRLVTKIETSITRADNIHENEKLVNQLAKLKGENNSYILKLKAFCYIRNGDYGAAAGLLKKVLAKNSDDLDAVINMAVIEIKQNRLQKARERLIKLQEVYPENILISEILQKLAQ